MLEPGGIYRTSHRKAGCQECIVKVANPDGGLRFFRLRDSRRRHKRPEAPILRDIATKRPRL